MQKTPLYDEHIKLSAKMDNFAGWLMPIQYTSIIGEHNHTRNHVGIFDISHMGQIEVFDSSVLQNLTTNDIFELDDFRGQYSFFCNEQGGVLDDVILYKLPDKYLIIANAVNSKKIYTLLKDRDKKVEFLKNNFAIAVQGPNAIEISEKVFDDNKIHLLKKRQLKEIFFKDMKGFLSRSGYTGEDGVEIFFDKTVASLIWQKFLELGAKPCGLASRDILRIEAALPLYGHEIDENTTPIEAGLEFAVKIKKENFIGKKALFNQIQNGTQKRLFGFKLNGKVILRQGHELFSENKKIGYVTSGTFSPTLNASIFMAYIYKEYFENIDLINVTIREKTYIAQKVTLPFYRKH